MASIRAPHQLPQLWEWEVGPIPVPRMQVDPETNQPQLAIEEGPIGLSLTISDASGFKTMFMTLHSAQELLKIGQEKLEEARAQEKSPGLIIANGKVDEKEAAEFLRKNRELRGLN